MILPRRLMTYTDKAGRVQFCEEHDPRQMMNFRPKGYPIPDAEAQRIGLMDYLNTTGWGEVADADRPPETDAKAVEFGEVENKAVEMPAMEEKDDKGDETTGTGLQLDPALRRGRRG